jgi:hypothetical protein
MPDRLLLIQTLMKQKKLRNYLEIGVFNGHIFFRVKSRFKVAVDPAFKFDRLRKIGKVLLNPFNFFNQYFQKTSDVFFAEDANRVFAEKKIQIALIDGMHEYEFALRDIENTLRHLADDGVIIVHDCNALTRESSSSFSEWKAGPGVGTWNGNIWKTILHLRTLRRDLTVFVLDCDHGLGIVTKGKPDYFLSYTREQIERFSFEEFNENRKDWIGLREPQYFYSFFGLG